MADVAIDARHVWPIRLDCDNGKPVLFDEALRDRRTRAVELRSAMRCFAKQDHFCITETVEKSAKTFPFRYGKMFSRRAEFFGEFMDRGFANMLG
jgi:hypothetical protein